LKFKTIYLSLFLFLALLLSLSPSILAGPKLKYVVVKGDNLWSICQRYYNDAWIWPELWEMNQFITNPHWIKPGEIITIYEYEMLKANAEKKIVAAKKEEPLNEEPIKEPIKKGGMGIDVSTFTNVNALGFLQQQREEPWGTIFDLEAEKILVGKGDTVYVKMLKEGIKPEDRFTIYETSNPIKHPVTGEHCGYIHIFKGTLEIKTAQEGYHIAQISESYRTIHKHDLLIPYYPVSSCIVSLPCQGTPTAYVAAAKDNLDLHGQNSVVYIDAGRDRGIMTGNLFEVIRERESISEPEKDERVSLPPTILGKILILETKEKTATGVVFWASKDFANGAKIRPCVSGLEPKELATLPTCPIQ
jgi:hypothetical protein